MKETVLNALLQLFAIIANASEDGVSFKARSIVKAFLRQHLKTNLIHNYLVLFDNYLEIHHPHLFGGGISPSKQTLSDSDKLKRIAGEINRSLLQREKFIVFLRLVEFINEDDVMTNKELAFIKTVSETFNISSPDHDNTVAFVLNACDEIEKERILVIDKNDTPFIRGIRHLQEKEMEGRIAILHHSVTNTFVFRYLGGMNLFLNGHPIIPERFELLEQGSLITGAMIRPIYYSDISRKFHHMEESSRIFFVAEHIEYTFKNSTKGIKKFSFSKESGNLIGIMGGSGAGKSTLLNILSGQLKPQGGRITINGFDIHKDKSKIEGIIGFVPQDDLLIEDLTVFRNLYLNAKLCLDNHSETELLRRVNQILVDLDLDHIKYLKVGNPLKKLISGGQRKRLNIALELIREPAVLFVDEPTSGLSSMGSEKVMLLLKEQALKGRLVIVNIHQPYSDIYKLFDRFLILDMEGYVIYKGNPIDAITYFKTLSNYVNAEMGHCDSCGNVMPEEILKIVEAKEIDEYGKLTKERKVAPEEWYDIYLDRIESKQKVEPVAAKLPDIEFKIPGPFKQFWIFGLRNVLSKLANSQYLLIQFLEAPFLALIVGYFTRYSSGVSSGDNYVFRDNVNLPVYMFTAVIVAMFMGMMASADEIIKDRKLLQRESFLRLSRISYLNSKILVLFLISAIQTFTFVLVGNSILAIKGMLFYYWAVLFTVSCLANMIELNISSGVNSTVNAYIVIPFIVVPQLLFSGMLINFDKLNSLFKDPSRVPLIGELMTSKWAFESLAVNQFKNNKFTGEFFTIDQTRYNASYQVDYIDMIESKLNDARFKTASGKDIPQAAKELELVSNELINLSSFHVVSSFGPLVNLQPDRFSETTYRMVTDSLHKVQDHFKTMRREADRQKDEISKGLLPEWGGRDGYLAMKKAYTNERLEEMLTNKGQFIVESNNRLIRKTSPIYMMPETRYGKSHFYAPVKRVGNLTFDTFWFNLLIIWFSCLIYYLTLGYDLVGKITQWDRVRRLRKRR